MSERQPHYEAGRNIELDSKELEKQHKNAAEHYREAAENAPDKKESLETIRKNIERAAASKKEIEEASRKEAAASESVANSRLQFKGSAFKQLLREVQRQETPAQRRFSKVIHQPAVEEISNLAEGTVARPSGLLFGGLFSALSSIVVLYICRHYGYEYNFLIGLASFAGGFCVGLLLEGLSKLFSRNKQT